MKSPSALLSTAALMALLAAAPIHAAPLQADLDAPVQFNIPAQSLDLALIEYSRQTGVQVISSADAVRGLSAQALRGESSPRAAMGRLLQGSGLTFVAAGKTVTITAGGPARVSAPAGARPLTPAALATPGPASPAAPPPAALTPVNNVLQEVVVTATRQVDTANRVPLSITAETQKTLDQAGVKKVDDLARTVPGFNITKEQRSGDPSYNIRGISSSIGAPTAGFYLDDTPLTKRNGGIGLAFGVNGPPMPQIFDLERVEVLRGPQGTLYGGSSEGGNIRFITPTPSLKSYSTYARVEASVTKDGDPSYEAGYATGGPLIQDKLGFRAAVWIRHTGGYVDHVDQYTGKTLEANTNSGEAHTLRATLLWAATDRLRISPGVFFSYDRVRDSDVWWENVPQYVVKGTTFSNSGTINGVKYAFAPFTFPGFTDGPYNMFGPYKTGTNYYHDTVGGNSIVARSPRRSKLLVPSLSADYDVGGGITAHNTLSYIADDNSGYSDGRLPQSDLVTNGELPGSVTGTCGSSTTTLNPAAGCKPIKLPGLPYITRFTTSTNRRMAWTEEFRLSSQADARPFSWVIGGFFSNSRIHALQRTYGNTDEVALFFHGIPEPYLTGVSSFIGANGQSAETNNINIEREYAGFGEVNWHVTDQLKLTGGIRVSHDRIQFLQETGGQNTGAPAGFVGTTARPFPDEINTCPTSPAAYNPATIGGRCPLVYTNAVTEETPVTPKVSLSYQITPDKLVYVTAAKGYRTGGVNPPVSAILCAVDFAALGITATPQQYQSDSLWSYEAGAKLRLANRAQINASLFYIDWNNVQTNARLSQCGRTYTINGTSAVSKGGDVQWQVKIVGGLSTSGTVAYTDAYYSRDLFGIGSGATPPRVLTKGEPLPNNPKWQYNVGLRYDFAVTPTMPAYLQVDYQYKSSYNTDTGPMDVGHLPLNYKQGQTNFTTLRAGTTIHAMDVSIFVNNLTNSIGPLSHQEAGQSALFTDTSFRPREIGIQLAYRH